MKRSVVDSLKARMSQSVELRKLNKQKQHLARVLLGVCVLSLLVMCFDVELSLRQVPRAWTNGLKCFQIGLLLFIYYMLVLYHGTDIRTEKMTYYTRTGYEKLYPLFEALLLLVGVMPPFVHATFHKHNLIVPEDDSGTSDDRAPIDTLGVLMFYARLPLVFKWSVTSFVMSSPSYIAWLYSVQVGPSFRFKFIFTQYPFRVITFSLTTAWLAGTYCLRAFEFKADEAAATHQLQVWAFVAYGYITASEIGLRQPISVLGQLTACWLALVGILNIAMLTAMFCGGTELDGGEVWLITQIERRNRKRRMAKRAARLLQRCFRHRLAQNMGNQVTNTFRDVLRAERRFKAMRLNTLNVDVSNIKTLHGLMSRMTGRMTKLEELMVEMHREMRERRRTGESSPACTHVGVDAAPPAAVRSVSMSADATSTDAPCAEDAADAAEARRMGDELEQLAVARVSGATGSAGTNGEKEALRT